MSKYTKIYRLNIHKFKSIFLNIFILLFLTIKIKAFSFFKTIPTLNNRYYIIAPNNLIFLNNYSNNYDIKVELINDQIIESEDEYEKISYGRFIGETKAHLLIIKNYIYAISDDGNAFCNHIIDEINGKISSVIPIQVVDLQSYFIIGMINSNYKLFLYLYENRVDGDCSASYTFSKEYDIYINSKSISCHYYTNLICFYVNFSNELISSIFNVDISATNKIEFTSSYPKENVGAEIVKSIYSSNLNKFFVCYINDENNCNCLIYDKSANVWGNPTNYLKNCINKQYSLNIQYFDSLNYYILSCFQTEKQFSFIKLDNNFEIIDDEENRDYYVDESLIGDCSTFSLGSLVNDTNNTNDNLKIFGICNSEIKKYEIQKDPLIPTTIQTTILTTIINNIHTTIPTTILTTIINKIIPTIPTIIQTTINNKIPTIEILTTPLISNQNKTLTTSIKTTKLTINNNAIFTTFSTTSLTSIKNIIPIITIKETQNKTKEELLNNIDEVMENYELDKIYEIFGNEYNAKISPINTNIYKNISTYINFANCENILKIENSLPPSSKLTVYQIEIDYPYEQTLIKRIEYAVFDENKKRLNLSVCQNEKIEINYQLDQTKINQAKVHYYYNLGIDIFDIKNEFFHDICYPYSEKDSDIVLKDRVSDIYENYSKCEINCEYNGINYSRNTIVCKCDVKTKISSTNEPPLYFDQMVVYTFKDSNIAVIKCYELVFDFRNKLNNIGFCIFSCLIIIHISIYIYYFIYNITSIQRYIISEMRKFGYLINVHNPIKNIKGKKRFSVSNDRKILEKMKNDVSEKILFKENSFKKIEDLNKPQRNKNTRNTINNLYSVKNKNIKLVGKENNKNDKKDNNLRMSNNKSITHRILNINYFKIFGNKRQLSEGDMKNNKNISSKYYSLIHIDANNSSNKKSKNSSIILDNYNFKTAVKHDKRSFWRIFYICLLAKENIMNIIFFKTPLDLQPIRICLFIFNYSCDLALNTIFYSNESISDKYHYEGNSIFVFSIVNNIIQSIFSSLISMVLSNVFQYMIEARGDFEDIFREEEHKMRKNKEYKVNKKTKMNIILQIRHICLKLKNKINIFLILEFLIMLFFYYFVTAFCEVYKKTQISWLYDFISSFLISTLSEIFSAWILAIFYYLSIRYEINLIYRIVIFFYNL